MAVYKDDKEYASSGVGTAALTTGIIGTTLASGILNGNGLGGIFGNNTRQQDILAEKNLEIAQLRAEKYSDNKDAIQEKEICELKQRVAALEVAQPLREQVIMERIGCIQGTIAQLVKPVIPNSSVAPGWGPSFFSMFPPPPVPAPATAASNSSSTSTSGNG